MRCVAIIFYQLRSNVLLNAQRLGPAADGAALYTPGLSERRNGSSLFYNSDDLGNLWSVEDSTGQAEAGAYLFTGFGAPTYTGSGSGSASPLKYGGGNGCQTDYDTGLVLMGHRYYDTRIGRFISQDSIKSGSNWYAYTGNNPVSRVDPTGLYWDGGTVSGNLTPAQAEATAEWNHADPGQTFDVTTSSGKQYSFTVPGGQSSVGMGFGGWSMGLGIAGEFIHGTSNHNRNYGPNSTQAKNMRNSNGYRAMLIQIMNGQTSGNVSTPLAAFLTATELGNGTQAQLGAFEWSFTDLSNSNLGIDITNNITVNSLFYHVPGILNNLGVPNPSGILDSLSGGSPNFAFATQWASGPGGTIYQKIHLNFP